MLHAKMSKTAQNLVICQPKSSSDDDRHVAEQFVYLILNYFVHSFYSWLKTCPYHCMEKFFILHKYRGVFVCRILAFLVLQLFPLTLGVLLGFFISSWVHYQFSHSFALSCGVGCNFLPITLSAGIHPVEICALFLIKVCRGFESKQYVFSGRGLAFVFWSSYLLYLLKNLASLPLSVWTFWVFHGAWWSDSTKL